MDMESFEAQICADPTSVPKHRVVANQGRVSVLDIQVHPDSAVVGREAMADHGSHWLPSVVNSIAQFETAELWCLQD